MRKQVEVFYWSNEVKDCLRPKQVAKRWGIAYGQVTHLIASGKLAAINVSTGDRKPRWVITPESIEEFERANSNRVDPPVLDSQEISAT